jgi:hypothetical protein
MKLKSMPEIAASGSRRSTVVCNSSSLIDKVAKNYDRIRDASLANACDSSKSCQMTWVSSSRSSGALNPLTVAFSSNFKHFNENSGETNRRLYVERGHVLERLPGVT